MRTNHFNPLVWEINIENYSLEELETDPVAQAVFVHEYLHYIQQMIGTVGRFIFKDILRIGIGAALEVQFGSLAEWSKHKSQIDVWSVLSSNSGLLHSTVFGRQYNQLIEEIGLTLAGDGIRKISIGDPSSIPPFSTDRYMRGNFSVEGFPFMNVIRGDAVYSIPLNDGVFYENMARQVQRSYLVCNNTVAGLLSPDLTPVDSLRKNIGEISYVCIHDYLDGLIDAGEPRSVWTIVLCQRCLQCRFPGKAFVHMCESLRTGAKTDLNTFVFNQSHHMFYKGEFNTPPLQEVINELVLKWGTALIGLQRLELSHFTQRIARAHNACVNMRFFAPDIIRWNDVLNWIDRFGCPQLIVEGKRVSLLCNKQLDLPWRDHFVAIFKALAKPVT
jgi:hypothetical protein